MSYIQANTLIAKLNHYWIIYVKFQNDWIHSIVIFDFENNLSEFMCFEFSYILSLGISKTY